MTYAGQGRILPRMSLTTLYPTILRALTRREAHPRYFTRFARFLCFEPPFGVTMPNIDIAKLTDIAQRLQAAELNIDTANAAVAQATTGITAAQTQAAALVANAQQMLATAQAQLSQVTALDRQARADLRAFVDALPADPAAADPSAAPPSQQPAGDGSSGGSASAPAGGGSPGPVVQQQGG